jgi:hypothetical protein
VVRGGYRRQRLRRANGNKEQGHLRVQHQRVPLIVATLIGQEAIRHHLASIAGGEVLQGDVLFAAIARGRGDQIGAHGARGVGEAIAGDTQLGKPRLEVGQGGLVEAARDEGMDTALMGAGIGDAQVQGVRLNQALFVRKATPAML